MLSKDIVKNMVYQSIIIYKNHLEISKMEWL